MPCVVFAKTKPFYLRTVSFVGNGQNDGVNYRTQNLDFALRHGIGNNSFGLDFDISRFSYMQNTDTQRNFALSGVNFFHRRKLASWGIHGISAQYSIQTPNFRDQNISTNSNNWEYETRVLYMHNLKSGRTGGIIKRSVPYFFRAELAYRTTFRDFDADIMRYRLLAALQILPKSYFFLEHKIDWHFQNGRNILDHNIEFSIMQSVTDKTSMQVGAYKRLNGSDQDYDSYGLIFGFWQELDFRKN